MDMTKASLMTLYFILALPLIILFSIGIFAWHFARAISNWFLEDFRG
jgi:uncharacterized BrkB/YihY/UPF0761 family membrane protein